MRGDAFIKRTRAGLIALAASVGLLSGCEAFDPVRTQDLCDRGTISMRCPACQSMPYAEQCSICKGPGPEKDDPSICRPANSAATNPDGGEDSGPDAAPTSGEGGGGTGGSGNSGTAGGAGAGATGAGRGGASGSAGGAGSRPPMNSGCIDDLGCMLGASDRPACDTLTKVCVECTENKHCSGALGVCNRELHRCQNCVKNDDCASGACDENAMVCVDCKADAQCKDAVNNACDTVAHTCVDCMANQHCNSDGVHTTCDVLRRTCVDCMDDVDCGETGKRACNQQERVCVPCQSDVHCKDPVLGTCDKERQECVDCRDNTGCTGTNKYCDTERQACVECQTDSQCTSNHCVDQKCVECEADTDCRTADASHCDTGSHECVGCTANAQCAHLSQTRACDTANERCVACNDDSTCGGKACIRAQHTCSSVNVNSLSVCLACEADSQCMTNLKCVELSFDSEAYGKYCVFTRASRGNNCSTARPYTQQLSNARSVDGTTTNYCVPYMRTTCPGVLDVALGSSGMTCDANADCGVGIGDALCSDGKCTYSCGAAADCPVGLNCPTGGTCG